jgi:NAD(P)-dependent dehydrogenase (short-subunit alcohol dehydrogenase family)
MIFYSPTSRTNLTLKLPPTSRNAHAKGYGAAKAGLVGLTHAQAASLAGVARVNCVCPGWIDTSGDAASLRPEDHAWHWTGERTRR